MKKILLAAVCALGMAGAVSAETIALDTTKLNTNGGRHADFHYSVTVNTLTQNVCEIMLTEDTNRGISQTCERFQDLPDYVQGNVLLALEATGNPWRPTVPETWKDEARDLGAAAGNAASRAGNALKNWANRNN